MPVQNVEVAWVLHALADLLEIDGDNPYRVRAYRTAARTVSQLDEPLHQWVEAELDLTELPAVGSEIAAKIREIVQTGRLGALERLTERVPLSLRDLLALPGLGAKQVRALHAELGITTLAELIEALDDGRVASLRGFGAKRVRQLRGAAEREIARERRWRIDIAEQLSRSLIEDLQSCDEIEDVYVAGSLRRRCETIGDVDLVVVTPQPDEIAELITDHGDISDSERDELGVKARFRSGLPLEVRIVSLDLAGIAMLWGTGSSGHRQALIERAQAQELELRDDGLFDDNDLVAAESETDVYVALGLDWIPPELREAHGEIEAAAQGDLPELITTADIRGDLQTHTTFSDGEHTLAEMAEAARARGYAYIAITDHSQRMRVANGLTPERLRALFETVCEAVQHAHQNLGGRSGGRDARHAGGDPERARPCRRQRSLQVQPRSRRANRTDRPCVGASIRQHLGPSDRSHRQPARSLRRRHRASHQRSR